MKVAFVSQPWDSFDPLKPAGSVGLWIWQVSRRLARSCEVTVFAPGIEDGPSSDRREGVQFIRLPSRADARLISLTQRCCHLLSKRQISFDSTLFYRAYATAAAKAARARRCDIIHIHNLSQFVPIMRRFNPDARIVLHMHCNWLVQLDRKLIDARIAHADAIIGCSEYVTSAIRDCFPNRAYECHTVFNGVDTTIFHPSGSNPGGREVIAFVGRISPEKGLHVLIDAFREVSDSRLNTCLTVIGGCHVVPRNYIVDLDPNPDVGSLRQFYGKENYLGWLHRCLDNNFRHRVFFVGEVFQANLASYLRRSTLLIAPSLVEAFGMPAVEAMAVGLPVVASQVGGLPEIVVDGVTGLLTRPADPAALAESILRILGDKRLAASMGEAGSKRALSLFTWENTVDSLLGRYADIL